MSKAGLGANTSDIAKRGGITSEKAGHLRDEINSLANNIDELGKVCKGPSFVEFKKSFEEQKTTLMALSSGLDNLGEVIEKGSKTLADTETSNEKITRGIF